MKNIKKSNNLPKVPAADTHPFQDALFLDIETTGFSAARNYIYQIGTAYLQNDALITRQLFAETPQEEAQVITALHHLLEPFHTVITFHGSHFDLPFLKKRSRHLKLSTSIYDNKNYVDLCTLARSYKHIFGLENSRQKTLEAFLGHTRTDTYSGGDLIKVYESYVRQPQEEALAQMLQHNLDDLTGMVQLLALSAYDHFFQGGFTPDTCSVSPYRRMDGSQGKELTLSCQIREPLPAAVSCKNDFFYLHASDSRAVFSVPLLEGTLKYFYPDYKNYYYLPQEDTAIHKSVAFYVDAAHRQKAKAANCYSKKTGCFLPQYQEVVTPALYAEYKGKISYFEWTDERCRDLELWKRYGMHVLGVLKSGK